MRLPRLPAASSPPMAAATGTRTELEHDLSAALSQHYYLPMLCLAVLGEEHRQHVRVRVRAFQTLPSAYPGAVTGYRGTEEERKNLKKKIRKKKIRKIKDKKKKGFRVLR